MKFIKYSHNNGDKLINKDKLITIEDILNCIHLTLKPRCASQIRDSITEKIRHKGWSEEIHIHAKRQLTITSMNERIALCIQTGNMARFYADLLKIQVLFNDRKIDGAIYILPSSAAAKVMGQNMANFERFTSEIRDIFSSIITTPIMVYGFDSIPEGDK